MGILAAIEAGADGETRTGLCSGKHRCECTSKRAVHDAESFVAASHPLGK
jgi:hypothetical protein